MPTSNFLTTGFPATRWTATDSAADLAAAINSIDTAIRYVLFGGVAGAQCDFATKTKPVKFSDGLVQVLDNFQIGTSEIVDDIVATIPLIPGMNEAHELATVEALRAFIVAYSESWGEDIYIPIITTPTAGNFPVMTADGELATSSWNQDTWITRIVGPISGNFPMMQPNGLLSATAWGADDFMKSLGSAPTAGNLAAFVDADTLSDSGYDPSDFVAVTGDSMTGDLTMSLGVKIYFMPSGIEEERFWVDKNGLNASEDIGVTRSSIHLGFENSDIGTPYYRDTSGTQYELLHKGNFAGITGGNTGGVHAKKAVPGNAGSAFTKIAMDTVLWEQGEGDDLFSLSSGNIKVSTAGIYLVSWYCYLSGDVQVRLMVKNTDETHYAYGGAELVSGDGNTSAEMTGVFLMDANEELEFYVRTPIGTTAINGNAATVVKLGVDGGEL